MAGPVLPRARALGHLRRVRREGSAAPAARRGNSCSAPSGRRGRRASISRRGRSAGRSPRGCRAGRSRRGRCRRRAAVNHFARRGGELYCEEVPLARIAQEAGTPTYVYSSATLCRHARVFREALGTLPDALCCYAVKAAGNLALLSLLSREGYGFDIVSGGELFRALRAGAVPSRIVFSGVGKRVDELSAALDAGILQFNCESEEELRQLSRVAVARGKLAPVAVRVNPQVDAKTHPYIATALATSKFGVPAPRARAAFQLAQGLPGLRVVVVPCHIGSQIGELKPFVQAAQKMRALALQLREDGHDLRHLDLGGGLGVPYGEGPPPAPPEKYGRARSRELAGLDLRLLLEPGRLIVANACVLLSRVLLRKR